MSSAARSRSTHTQARTPERTGERTVLSGPVSICVDRPVLALDRPFTYELPADLGAGLGSLVQVPFHGRAVRGWVLGPTDDVPERIAQVRRTVSPVRFFDAAMLELLRWMSERYVAPLATIITRAVPPRVASEELALQEGGSERNGGSEASGASRRSEVPPARVGSADQARVLGGYRNGPELLEALSTGGGTFVLRPAPAEEADVAVGCVRATLAGGRNAIVVVPEADPLPATAAAVAEAFGDEVLLFLGGDRRERYGMWLRVAHGGHRVVVGTRPAVFAPLRDVGLVYVHREGHAQHREERSPRSHVRDVARARSEIEGAVCVLSAFHPAIETSAFECVEVRPPGRPWAPVEVVRPGPEGRSPRLVRALRAARGAFLFEPMRGYGVARVCRLCGEAAACAACLGTTRVQRGGAVCIVCGAPGRCASCGASDFGVVRGGAERVEEWAAGIASVPVVHLPPDAAPRRPGDREVLVGGVDLLKDFGRVGLDLVAILHADSSLGRPGIASREHTVTAWFEAAAWADPAGRVIVQTRHPSDPAVQALVTFRPERFHRAEAARRAEAGFPVGSAVFRVTGTDELEAALAAGSPRTLLASAAEGATVCLVALDPGDVPAFGREARRLASRGVVTRVEAEPHL
ncbi:MAG: hypothetical protein L0206_03665 [Actinobacteria bacterium]|nr:hypothetical protein [Actinomycetota bacterium]